MDAELRLKKPDPQATFGFAECHANSLLAMPVKDILRWRLKLKDLRHPRVVVLHTDWPDDGRWQDLMEKVRQESVHTELEIISAVTLIAFELIRNPDAVGLQRSGTRLFPSIIKTWSLSPSMADVLEYAAFRAITAGIFEAIHDNDQFRLSAYSPAQRRDSEKMDHDTESPVRAAPPRAAARRALDTTRPDVTGHDQTTTVGDLPVSSGVPDKNGPVLHRTDRNDDDDDLAPKGGDVDAAGATKRIAEWAIRFRVGRGKRAWPDNVRDRADLFAAVRSAFGACAGDPLKLKKELSVLCDTLKEAFGWADDGAGIRKYLRDRGWI